MFSTPRDLAAAIGGWLRSIGTDSQQRTGPVPDDALVDLCETLYMASVATEEGEFVCVELVYINPEQVRQTDDASWQVFAFAERFPFTLPNLIKLAAASDPRNSAMAVFHDADGCVFIWGMIDQRDPAYRVLRREVSSRPHESCGIFEASIEGPANIFVHSGHELIGELNVGSLRQAGSYIDVFRAGPVSEICDLGIRSIANRLSSQLGKHGTEDVYSLVREGFISALCTLLLRLQTFRHGGAIVIRKSREDHLKIRYPIQYDRLTRTLEQGTRARLLQLEQSDSAVASAGNVVLAGCDEILDSAIWFVAVLSRVDGLVVVDQELGVEGFGAIIRCQDLPRRDLIFRSNHAGGADGSLTPLDYEHLGTRHQSMMRYCFEHQGTVGFVVSEDGDVRAMSWTNGKLIVWENIKLLNVS